MKFRKPTFYFMLLGLIITMVCITSTVCPSTSFPQPVHGLLDLSKLDPFKIKKIPLSGEWELYYGKLLYPNDFDQPTSPQPVHTQVPLVWNNQQLPHFGWATYRLKILVPPELHSLSFKIEEMFTAYALYINGVKVASVGEVGMSRDTVVPNYKPLSIQVPLQSQICDIVLQIANFHHKKGGFWRTIYIGANDSLVREHAKAVGYDMLIFGAIMMIALYHVALYSIRRKERSSLFFGLFSFFIAMKLSVANERILVQTWDSIPWEVLVKTVYLSFYLAMPCLLNFFYSLFPTHISKRIVTYYWIMVAAFCLFVLLTPSWIYSYTMLPFEVFTLLCIGYLMLQLFIAAKSIPDARIMLIGFLVLAATGVNDILFDNHMVRSVEMLHYGLLAFIFFQSFILSRRFSFAFNKIEHLTADLRAQADELEKRNTELLLEMDRRINIEKQLLQAQKMEAVGMLTGGIAHDFNNILSCIIGTTSILRFHLNNSIEMSKEFLTDKLSIAENAANRAAQLVKQLLIIAKKHDFSVEALDLNHIVAQVSRICENTLDKSIQIETIVHKKPAVTIGDATFIEQVLLNLCINAAHAMTIMRPEQEKTGGILTLSIEHFPVDDTFKNNTSEALFDSYWLLSVEDTGIGIPDDIRDKLFDPFFTTKSDTKGTGLGLAMAETIIRQHKGFIKIYSQTGVGTTFSVYLPVAPAKTQVITNPYHDNECIQGKGLILVVDDDDFVLPTSCSMLSACGYDVLSADNGEDAIHLFKEHHEKIVLVLLDIAMPHMSGKEVYIALKHINASCKVLLSSGLRHDPQVDFLLSNGASGFIHKPFSLHTLSQNIHSILTEQ